MDTPRAKVWADGPLLVGTDGSDTAAAAVLWAAREATLRNQALHIVHATDVQEWGTDLYAADVARILLEAPRRILDEAARLAHDLMPDLRVTTEVSGQSPWAGLLNTANEATTIAVGSRGLGGFGALLLGSVGLKVASHATGPVVVVRGAKEPAAGKVVAGVRNEADLDAARFAARTAARRKDSLHLLTAWTVGHYLGDRAVSVPDEVAASEQVTSVLRQEFPGLTVNSEVTRVASPAGALVEASTDADLVVVGARNPAHTLGTPLGHVTHAVLHHAHCPVAVLPHGG
ncbi:universal stress protein [Streptomyces monashensis]|uniref:universal stress protein n=1 Tax=Streptomyces monashensis TaxID=1678012 RepID=UPI0033CE3932